MHLGGDYRGQGYSTALQHHRENPVSRTKVPLQWNPSTPWGPGEVSCIQWNPSTPWGPGEVSCIQWNPSIVDTLGTW